MVYNLEVTLAVEYAASTGRGTTIREKASYVGQGAANGALDPAFTWGDSWTPVFVCQSLLPRASFQCSVSRAVALTQELFCPPGDVWQGLETFFGWHNCGGCYLHLVSRSQVCIKYSTVHWTTSTLPTLRQQKLRQPKLSIVPPLRNSSLE